MQITGFSKISHDFFGFQKIAGNSEKPVPISKNPGIWKERESWIPNPRKKPTASHDMIIATLKTGSNFDQNVNRLDHCTGLLLITYLISYYY